MYSNLKNVQYLLAALKTYGIKHVVVSPGNSHNAIVRSMEEDNYFATYNVVDERSAAFFACGLCQEKKETVAICCTAGTAASNYLTGITEASRRSLPIVVITGDKNPYYLAQYEDQMIENMSIFSSVVRHGCKLPIIENEKDAWYCQRILNETLLALNHHGRGPVHIDVPIEIGMLAIGRDFTSDELPEFNKINRIDLQSENAETVRKYFDSLFGKKIFIMCGQDDHILERENVLIADISKKYNCVFATDKLSNLHGEGTVEVTRAARAYIQKPAEFMPDVIISIAGNPAMDYKFQLKSMPSTIEHWIVNEEGRIADPFKKLKVVFEGNTIGFLEAMAQYGNPCDNTYYQHWKKCTEQVMIPEFEYSNLYTVQKAMRAMPPNTIFNIANSTTIRIAQFFDLDESIQVYCNRGVNGIDGCVSAFIGQAYASPDKLNFLIVGDLTFFYDMNSIWNRYVGKNVRIMLNNNEGAALFHFNQGLRNYPTLNENVAAEHFATAKGWVEAQGFTYLCAHNKDEFDMNLEKFVQEESDKPIFFEVFTHKDIDAEIQHNFYDEITVRDAATVAKDGAKRFLKSVLGDEMVRKLKGN